MTEARRRLGLRDLFTDGRVALMLPLGFSSGLPFLLVFSTLSAWLREAGISRTEIGMLSWVALAYSLKFLWAPIVDRYDVPLLARLLGRRRGWMVLAQLATAVGLVGIALSEPATSLGLTIASALLVAFASATQDVVIDGWRIDATSTDRQGMMAASLQLGYRLSLICAGAGALYIAEFVELAQRLSGHGGADERRIGRRRWLLRASISCRPPSGFPSGPPSSSRSPICFGARA